MSLIEQLTQPIPGDNPAGSNLRYEPVYDAIKEARRFDDPNEPRGAFERDLKKADWRAVVDLATDALENRTKDLQIAAWLCEGLLRREGFTGLREGLGVVHTLLERFWDHVYPEIDEDGDLEFRAAPLGWLSGDDLLFSIREAPLNSAGHSLIDHDEARRLGPEEEATTPEKKAARAAAAAEGRVLPEDWEEAFGATPKSWLKELVEGVSGSIEATEALASFCDENFGDVSPNLLPLEDTLNEVRRVADKLLEKKLELEPDTDEEATAGVASDGPPAARSGDDRATATPDADDGAPAKTEDEAPRAPSLPASVSADPTSWEDAAQRIGAAAKYLRAQDPANPAPFLLLRGLRWGELRAQGENPDPRLLEAPPTRTRTHLKELMLDGQWEELVEVSEDVMATPFGRGWLDLQRYVFTALGSLGGQFGRVTEAIRAALLALLTDIPRLPEFSLMDDSPTANRDTRIWLRDTIGFDGFTEAAAAELQVKARGLPAGAGRAIWERAMDKVRAGQTREAIELLMDQAAREESERERFLRRAEASTIMVDAGMEQVALPILKELLSQIDQHKLEEWESGETLAQPMSLLYRSMVSLEGKSQAAQTLYLRLCKLDPMQAIQFSDTGSRAGSAPPAATAEAATTQEGGDGEAES